MERPPAITEGIDRHWLMQAFQRDPVSHAFAAWDLDHEVDRARFVAYGRPGSTVAYLLIWLGNPAQPFVQWVGPPHESMTLADRLPPRPLSVTGAPAVVEAVAATRGAFTVTSLLRLTARPPGPVPMSDDPRVRPVLGPDADRLRAWASGHPDPMGRGYAQFDPSRHMTEPHPREVVWAAFHGDRVVGAAFASVRLPSIWTFNGIFVDPFARGEKLGTALTAHALEAARRAGAMAHLNVREDNAPARRAYERLGFTEHDRVVLVEAKD
jgi:GNAT superfamily N-acetyltransferase